MSDKLLRALIDALGYEVEEVYTPLGDFAISNWNNNGQVGERPASAIDYKLTKKGRQLMEAWVPFEVVCTDVDDPFNVQSGLALELDMIIFELTGEFYC